MELFALITSIVAIIFSGFALWYKRKSYIVQKEQYIHNLTKDIEKSKREAIDARPEFEPGNNWKSISQQQIWFNLVNVGKEARNIKLRLDTNQDFLNLKPLKKAKRQTNESLSIVISKPPGTGFGDYVFKLKISFSDFYEKNHYYHIIECNKGELSLSRIRKED